MDRLSSSKMGHHGLQKLIILYFIQSYDIGTGVDNIEVDPLTGDLWIGCHPLNWAIMDFKN